MSPTINDLERTYLMAQTGLGANATLADLRYAFYSGVNDGSIAVNTTMRVDNTVGSRVFISDGVTERMVKGETGPIRATGLYLNGAGSIVAGEVPTISRDNSTVVLQFTGKAENWISGDTFAKIPVGFRSATTQYLPNGYSGATASATMNGLGEIRFHTNGLVSGRWVWTWTTKDPWPTVLPGTPL